MRILWYGAAPWTPTGYGQQTLIWAPRIARRGHDVRVAAYFGLQGAAIRCPFTGLLVYPADDVVPVHHLRMLPRYVADHGGRDCQVVTLVDVWVLNRAVIRELSRVACWVPVDHEPCPPRVAEFFHVTGARPIAMSQFGERMLRAEGLDPLYVPHGIDTRVFSPRDKASSRVELGFPPDSFVVGMVANNQGNAPPRKAFPQAIEAFAGFRTRHPDAFLYLHCERSGVRHGVNLPELCATFDVPERAVGWAPQTELELGIPQETLAKIYSSMDVLLNPSYGEGFGLPIVEAQACGVPVIVSNWSSMPELCGGGWAIGSANDRWWDGHHRSFFLCPPVDEIVDALDQAYDEAAGMRDEAREFALQYDADRVLDTYWMPALAALDQPPPQPVAPNRAQRRKVAA